MNRIPRDKLIPNEKIKKGKRIGNGQFGEVYKGKAIGYGFFMVKAPWFQNFKHYVTINVYVYS